MAETLNFNNLIKNGARHNLYVTIAYNMQAKPKYVGRTLDGNKIVEVKGTKYIITKFDVFGEECWLEMVEYNGEPMQDIHHEFIKIQNYKISEMEFSFDHFKW